MFSWNQHEEKYTFKELSTGQIILSNSAVCRMGQKHGLGHGQASDMRVHQSLCKTLKW